MDHPVVVREKIVVPIGVELGERGLELLVATERARGVVGEERRRANRVSDSLAVDRVLVLPCVTDERPSRPGRDPHEVHDVASAPNRRDPLRTSEPTAHARVSLDPLLEEPGVIAAKLLELALLRIEDRDPDAVVARGEHERPAGLLTVENLEYRGVGRLDVADVGIEGEPDRRDDVVQRTPDRLGHEREAAVRPDDEIGVCDPVRKTAGALSPLVAEAGRPAVLGQHLDRLRARRHRDAGRGPGGVDEDLVEEEPPQAEGVGVAVRGPEAAADRGARLEPLPVDRDQPLGTDSLDGRPRADLLPDAEAVPVRDVRRQRVGRELGLVDEEHAQAPASEERREGGAPDARSDDDDVESLGHRRES